MDEREEKVPSCPRGPLRCACLEKKKYNRQNPLLAHRPWKCHSAAPLFPRSLSLTHFPHHAPPPSVSPLTSVSFIFTIVILLHLHPPSFPLSLPLSVVQCRSPHSACLQAVFLISLNYSRHFLLFFFFLSFFFFFFLPNMSSKLHKPENWVSEGLKITFTVNLHRRNLSPEGDSLTAAVSRHAVLGWSERHLPRCVQSSFLACFSHSEVTDVSFLHLCSKPGLTPPNWDWNRPALCPWRWLLNSHCIRSVSFAVQS